MCRDVGVVPQAYLLRQWFRKLYLRRIFEEDVNFGTSVTIRWSRSSSSKRQERGTSDSNDNVGGMNDDVARRHPLA